MSVTLPTVDVSGEDNPITLRTEISAMTHSSTAPDEVVLIDVNEIVAGLVEAIKNLEQTAQSVSFLGDMIARPSSANKLQVSHPTIEIDSISQPPQQAEQESPPSGASWFVDAVLTNGLKDQEIRSSVHLLRKAVDALTAAAKLNSQEQSGGGRIAPTYAGADSAGRLAAPSVPSTSAAGSARGGHFGFAPMSSMSPNVPSRSTSIRGGVDSTAGSFLGSTTRVRPGQQRAFADVDDTDIAQWLNENYSQVPKRATNGFEVQLDGGQEISMNTNLEPSDTEDEMTPEGPPHRRNTDGLHPAAAASSVVEDSAPVAMPPLPNTVEMTPSARAGSCAKDSPAKKQSGTAIASSPSVGPKGTSSVDGGATKYTRSTQRSFPAASSHKRAMEVLELMECPYLSDVDTPEFDVFAAHEQHGTNLLVYVAANIFSRYNFVRSLQLDVPTLRTFFETVRLFYRDVNPYHNTIHASDVLQSTHVYLCVGNVKENFSDVELLAVLFAALVHDVGHLGIANAFLIKIRHPLARLYNDISPLENSHAALAFALLERPECNFFTSSITFNRRLFDDFRSLVIEALHGTDMRLHADQTKSVEGILEDGVIEDHEVGKLLKAILHAADLSNPMKPLPIYLKWVDRVMAEFWQQGDEEKRREMPISILCDRNGTNVAKSQMGFISFVVKPFVKELAPVLPKVWLERLDSNWAALQQLTPEEEAERVQQISQFASRQWVDVDESQHPSCVQVLCGEVCAYAADEKLLQPNEFVATVAKSVADKLPQPPAPGNDGDISRAWSTAAHRESVAGDDGDDDGDVSPPRDPREVSYDSCVIPGGVGGGDSSLSEGDLVGGNHGEGKPTLIVPAQEKKKDGPPRHNLGHHQGSSRSMTTDIDADSTAFHVDAIHRLTSTASELSATARSAGGGDRAALQWVRTLCLLERERLLLREQLIERCRRGERRPTVLLVGNGSLRDDATDVTRFSLFACAPDAAIELLVNKLFHVTQCEQIPPGDRSTALHIVTSSVGALAKRLQLADILRSGSGAELIHRHTADSAGSSPGAAGVHAAAAAAAREVVRTFQDAVLMDASGTPDAPSPTSTASTSGGFNGKRKRVLSLIGDASMTFEDANRSPLQGHPPKSVATSDRNTDIFCSLGMLVATMSQLQSQQWGLEDSHNNNSNNGRQHSRGSSDLPPITQQQQQQQQAAAGVAAMNSNAFTGKASGTYLTRTALRGRQYLNTPTTGRSVSALDYSSASEPVAATQRAVELYALRTRQLPRLLQGSRDDGGSQDVFHRGLPSVWIRELKNRSPDGLSLKPH